MIHSASPFRPLTRAALGLGALALVVGGYWLAGPSEVVPDPTPEELGRLSPAAGGEGSGQMTISMVIPEQLAANVPAAVRVQRQGRAASSSRFDLCFDGTTGAGYRLSLADGAPTQQLVRHGTGGSSVVVGGNGASAVMTQSCREADGRAYSLQYAEAPAAFDRPVTVMVSPQ